MYIHQDVGTYIPGLPGGLFSNQKSQFWKNLEGLGVGNVFVFYDHFEYFTAIWYNLLPFVIVCCRLVHLFRFGVLRPRKIWQPWMYIRMSSCARTSGYIHPYIHQELVKP
jgi:hypothetical protein